MEKVYDIDVHDHDSDFGLWFDKILVIVKDIENNRAMQTTVSDSLWYWITRRRIKKAIHQLVKTLDMIHNEEKRANERIKLSKGAD